jgi:hypothetical protein
MVLAAGAAAAQSYNPFTQFSIKSNPAGAWSYVANGALLTAKSKTCNGVTKDFCWTNGGSGFPDVAADEANKTGQTISYADVTLPAKYLDCDPQSVSDVAFQWTAPQAGTVIVSGNFLGVAHDEGSHTVSVQHNGVALANYIMASYGQKQVFKFSQPVNRGDMISFVCETGNDGGALSTGLQAKIVYK